MALKLKARKHQVAAPGRQQQPTTTRDAWPTAYQNDLPDSCFAAVEEGQKDKDGKTVPRSKRHLVYRDKNGKVDLPHLRNALARLDQTTLPTDLKAKARKTLEAAARANGVGDYDTESEDSSRMSQPTTQRADAPSAQSLDDIIEQSATILTSALVEGGYASYDDYLNRAAPAADDEEGEEGDTEDEDEEGAEDGPEDETDEGEEGDEEEETAPTTKAKPKKKRATESAVTRAVSVKAFSTPGMTEIGYIPITRIDANTWEVEGVLSNEQVDTFGTVFDYDSMKRAVNERWHGNVREQHDPKKAIGKSVFAFCDDDQRQVVVRARISKGAPDTWQKVLDGVLCGYSIGAANAKTETRMIGDKTVPVYKDFDLAEISLVDAPSNPGAARSGLTIYRAAGFGGAAEAIYAAELAADEEPAMITTTPPAPAESSATAETAPASGAIVEQAQVATQTREISTDTGLTGYDLGGATPAGPAPAIDTGSIEAKMNTETGHAHTPHSHAYNGATVHENDHHHDHTDGTPDHAHKHMHAHAGVGDGSKPHVHLHEHGHQYRAAASDRERLADGGSRVLYGAFVGQDDPRVAEYLPKSAPTAVSSPVPAQRAAATVATPTAPIAIAPEVARVEEPDETRDGQRISADTRAGLHEAALAILRTCDCPYCQEAVLIYDPDNDGDDDVDATGDTDEDMAGADTDTDDNMALMGRVRMARLTRRVRRTVERQIQATMTPIAQQLRAISARLASAGSPSLDPILSQLREDRATVAAIKDTVERIAAQEQPGPMSRIGAPGVQDKTVGMLPREAGMPDFSPDQIAYLRRMNLMNPPTADQTTALAEALIRQQMAR